MLCRGMSGYMVGFAKAIVMVMNMLREVDGQKIHPAVYPVGRPVKSRGWWETTESLGRIGLCVGCR